VCKVVSGNEALTEDEQSTLTRFKITQEDQQVEDTFIDKLLKKPKLAEYIDLDFIPSTSNHAERFFSSAKLCLTSLRKRILPKNLEIQLFLKLNWSMGSEKLEKLLAQAYVKA
jgi:hypothetical protein